MPSSYAYPQYSGVWNLTSQGKAKAASTWPVETPKLYSWGNNPYGELGLGNTTSYSSPKQVGSLTTWSKITGGMGWALSLKTDGTLWSWGRGTYYGPLGLGNRTSYSSPKQVGALTNWLKVNCGSYHALAVKTDGTLWAWGSNGAGQLGLGNLTDYSSPKQVGSLTNWSEVAGTNRSSLAVKTDGTLWSWGGNYDGTLGLGNRTYYSSPKQVGSLTTWLKVSGGYAYVLATKTDGTLWSWGYNANGQLGFSNTTSYSSPKQVGSLTNWSVPYANRTSSGAIKTDNTLWTWGNNNSGRLGLGNTTYYSSPKQVGASGIWSSISSCCDEGGFVLGIRTDGTLWSWGYNGGGELGLGNTTYYSSPKQIGSSSSWTSVGSGRYGSYAIGRTF